MPPGTGREGGLANKIDTKVGGVFPGGRVEEVFVFVVSLLNNLFLLLILMTVLVAVNG